MKLADYKIKLSDYIIHHIYSNFALRHITLKTKDRTAQESLCKHGKDIYLSMDLDHFSKVFPYNYKSLCKKCFKKLPIKIQAEIKFRYMVCKLKNED